MSPSLGPCCRQASLSGRRGGVKAYRPGAGGGPRATALRSALEPPPAPGPRHLDVVLDAVQAAVLRDVLQHGGGPVAAELLVQQLREAAVRADEVVEVPVLGVLVEKVGYLLQAYGRALLDRGVADVLVLLALVVVEQGEGPALPVLVPNPHNGHAHR